MDATEAIERGLEARALAIDRLHAAGHDPERCRHMVDRLALAVAHVEGTTGREREQWLSHLGTVVTRLHAAPEGGPGKPPRLSRMSITHGLRVAYEDEASA